MPMCPISSLNHFSLPGNWSHIIMCCYLGKLLEISAIVCGIILQPSVVCSIIRQTSIVHHIILQS